MHIVMSACAKMPGTCWGKYKRVAVVKVVDPACVPAMISTRARGVVEIVATWEKLNVGKTDKCAYRKALAEAQALCDTLNAGYEVLT